MRGNSFVGKRVRDNAVSRRAGAPRRMSAEPTRELKSSFVTLRQRTKNPAKMQGNSFSEKQTRDNAVSHASVGAPRRMSAFRRHAN